MNTSEGLDAEHSRLYLSLMSLFLSKSICHKLLEATNSLGDEHLSDFHRRYYRIWVAFGRAEGRAEGRLEMVLRQLTLRFGPLTEAVQTRIRDATYWDLDAVSERLLTVQTLEEALSPLYEPPYEEGE